MTKLTLFPYTLVSMEKRRNEKQLLNFINQNLCTYTCVCA